MFCDVGDELQTDRMADVLERSGGHSGAQGKVPERSERGYGQNKCQKRNSIMDKVSFELWIT